MRVSLSTALVLSLLLAACAKAPDMSVRKADATPAGEAGDKAASNEIGDLLIATPVSYENLTIFPLVSKTPRSSDRFITLDEGLAAGSVEIFEIGADIDANTRGDSRIVQQVGDPPSADSIHNESAAPSDRPSDESAENAEAGEQNRAAQAGEDNPFGDDPFSDDPFSDDLFSDDLFDSSGASQNLQTAGDVNRLVVRNSSDKPLYLMPGEVIYGGKQNRTIAQEVTIPPGADPVEIDVFCVEQGRWTNQSVAETTVELAAASEFEAGLSLVTRQTQEVADLAQEAERLKFVASAGQLARDARLAVHGQEGQSRVWHEVAKTNATVGNNKASGDFAAVYLSSNVVDTLKPYVDHFTSIAHEDQIVGVAIAINGEMSSVDVFESTPLFRKLWPKLLKSYALDAAMAGDAKSKVEPCRVEECHAFLTDVMASPADVQHLRDGQRVVRRESSSGVSFSYYDADGAAAAESEGLGGGGFGGQVHAGAFAR